MKQLQSLHKLQGCSVKKEKIHSDFIYFVYPMQPIFVTVIK